MRTQPAPWRAQDGKTQVLTVPLNGTVASSAVGAQTYAVMLSVITGNCMVRVNQGIAASASQGILVKTTDPPLVLACGATDKVEAFGIAAGTLYVNELTR